MLHQYQTSSTASRPCVHAVRIHCLPPAVQRKPQGHEKAREQREDDEDAAQEGVSEEELAQHRHLPEPVVIPAVRHEVVARFRSERLREVAARRDLLKEIRYSSPRARQQCMVQARDIQSRWLLHDILLFWDLMAILILTSVKLLEQKRLCVLAKHVALDYVVDDLLLCLAQPSLLELFHSFLQLLQHGNLVATLLNVFSWLCGGLCGAQCLGWNAKAGCA